MDVIYDLGIGVVRGSPLKFIAMWLAETDAY